MSGINITWYPREEDVMQGFFDELCDMFGLKYNELWVTYQGRPCQPNTLAYSLPHAAWVSINFRCHGGGKRARGAKKKDDEEEKTKEDVIEYIEKQFISQEFPMRELSKVAPIANIVGSIEGTLKVMLTDANYVMVVLQSMSRDALVKIQNVLDAHNQVMKYNTLTNLLFKNEFAELKKHEDMINLVKERLRILTKYMFVKGFANEFGETLWTMVKVRIDDIKSERDKQQGRIEALAEQRAAEQRAREAFSGLHSVVVTPDAAVVSAPMNPKEV
jgi:hypothetical protein